VAGDINLGLTVAGYASPMSNIGFTNTKVALAFAGMTILGTLLMVGTPDNEGVLGQITSRLSEEPDDASRENETIVAASSDSSTAIPPKPDWANPVIEVSDSEVEAARPAIAPPTPAFAATPPPYSSDPAKAPLSPNAIISDDDAGDYEE
jgi:hypothetical protein